MGDMNPRMTEFLAQDRIAGLRSEAASHQLLERPADATPKIESRRRQAMTSPRALLGRWFRRATAV
jgi:hypothetical protein